MLAEQVSATKSLSLSHELLKHAWNLPLETYIKPSKKQDACMVKFYAKKTHLHVNQWQTCDWSHSHRKCWTVFWLRRIFCTITAINKEYVGKLDLALVKTRLCQCAKRVLRFLVVFPVSVRPESDLKLVIWERKHFKFFFLYSYMHALLFGGKSETTTAHLHLYILHAHTATCRCT